MSLFFSQHNDVVSPSPLLIVFIFLYFCFLITHECDHSFQSLLTSKLLCWMIILSKYTPPWKPGSGLILCSGDDAVDGNQSCSDNAPLFPLLVADGLPVKIRPGSLYDGVVLIVPEDGNNRGIWSPLWCGHRRSGCLSRHNLFATEAYPRLILQGRKNYW